MYLIELLLYALDIMPENVEMLQSIENTFSKHILLFLYYTVFIKLWKKRLVRSVSQSVLYIIMFFYGVVNVLATVVIAEEHPVILLIVMGSIVFANMFLLHFMKYLVGDLNCDNYILRRVIVKLAEKNGGRVNMKREKVICLVLAIFFFAVCSILMKSNIKWKEKGAEIAEVQPKHWAVFLEGGDSPYKNQLESLIPDDSLEAENSDMQYEHWTDFSHERNLPYASQQTFETVKGFYSEIDFFGEFQKGDREVYGKYKEAFLKLLQNEVPFFNWETGEHLYWKDFGFGNYKKKYDLQEIEYIFFDMNEDGFPELTVQKDGDSYIFQYDVGTNEFEMWYSMESGWYSLIGSRKVMWLGSGKYLAFYLLDQEGRVECETFFFANWFNEEESLFVVMVPQYNGEPGRNKVTDEMKAEGIYESSSGQWYFRVTEEQWDELADIYLEAEQIAEEKIKDVTYTYEELFGELTQ